MLRLITRWLTAGVVENGKRTDVSVGTPQGAVISPLLANIYLHYVYDLWLQRWRCRDAKGDVIAVRYADDSVVGFEREADTLSFLKALRMRLAKFGLALNDAKTRVLEFGRYAAERRSRAGRGRPEVFDFLGFTHICATTRVHGHFTVKRLTSAKRLRATLKALRQTLLQRRHAPIPVTGAWLRRVLQGYLNYHAIPGNCHRLTCLRRDVCRAWLYALRRRGQRHKMPWQRFTRLIERYIPPVRVLHPYPDARFAS
jgi:RNA-directed DNA polymerase